MSTTDNYSKDRERRRVVKIFQVDEFVGMENPTPGQIYRAEILTPEQGAENLGGIFGLRIPGSQGPYHYHNRRESLIFVISGEGIETVEEEDIPIKAGSVLYIPAGEKHAMLNGSQRDLRYLEFFTFPPVSADMVQLR
jgi:quercetin dioxygenase-like cupin family protein